MQRALQCVSLTAGVLGAGYVLHSFKTTRQYRPLLLPTHADMREHERKLKILFQDSHPNNAALQTVFERFLLAIEKNSHDYAEQYLREMIRQGEMTQQIQDGIIAYAASLGAVDMMSCLIALFGKDAVLCYPVFNEFNMVPCYYINRIKETLAQVYDTRGFISFENMKICMEVTQEKLRQQNPECESKLQHTEVMDYQDLEFKQKYADIISQWKREALETKEPVVGSVILKGRIHTSLLHMKIVANDDQSTDATLLHFSSTGHINNDAPIHEDYFQVTLALFSNVSFELAEDRLQKNHSGCTLFAVYFYETIMNFDRLMAFNNQYAYANSPNAIFLYANDHHTQELSNNKYKFSMPIAMTVGNQHYDHSYDITGLDKERRALRQQEFDKPADLASMKSAKQILQEVSVQDNYGRTHNIKIEQMRHDLGFRISQRLSFFANRRAEIETQYREVKRRY